MLNYLIHPIALSRENYDRLFALGVTMYGQMTAGSFCYIGPQVLYFFSGFAFKIAILN